VRAILTAAGTEFVTPLSVSGLTGEKVYPSLFDLTDEAEMGHIELSRDADLLVGSAGHRRPDGAHGGRPGRTTSPRRRCWPPTSRC
jgi:hypothetical protein